MEPFATAFATVISLLASYRAESRAEATASYDDFVAWARECNHDQLLALLEQNARVVVSIKALLNQNSAELLQKLNDIDEILASLASRIDGVAELALALHPQSEISDQALSILRQVEEAQASAFLLCKFLGGEVSIMLLDGVGSEVTFTEPRFIDDDLETLVRLGLPIRDFNKKGEPVYRFTRQASKLIAIVKNR